MYMGQVIELSTRLNVTTRVRMESGDTHEGKFIVPVGDGMYEMNLTKGGRVYLNYNKIESLTLLDNLALLEEASAKSSL